MKTSIADILLAERFIGGELPHGERLLFEAKLAIDKDLRRNLVLHKLVHRLVRLYHRKKIKREVVRVHNKLFQDPAKEQFRSSVLKHFNS